MTCEACKLREATTVKLMPEDLGLVEYHLCQGCAEVAQQARENYEQTGSYS